MSNTRGQIISKTEEIDFLKDRIAFLEEEIQRLGQKEGEEYLKSIGFKVGDLVTVEDRFIPSRPYRYTGHIVAAFCDGADAWATIKTDAPQANIFHFSKDGSIAKKN